MFLRGRFDFLGAEGSSSAFRFLASRARTAATGVWEVVS